MNIYSGFLILILITIFIWLLGGYNVVAGRITVGEIEALINYQGMVANPMNSFSVFFNSIEEAKTSINRIMEYIDYENEQSGEMKLESISTIEFSKVYFSYRNREKVLSDINFTVNRGEKILLVGRSGSGKSTIGKLFLGLYKQESGCIYINNRPLHCYSISDVREKITFISQESIFFNDTILKNIDLQEKSKFEDIIYYCSILDIKDEICEMPLQFNTVIDGNGGNLSGGQKKG